MAEITVDADIRGVDRAHPAFQGSWTELLADLRATPGVHPQERDVAAEPTAMGKGWETELIVGLTGTGTITGIVQAFKLWLGRDRRRSVTVTVHSGGQEARYEISGENISTDTLQTALGAVVEQEHRKRK